jgi:hypothetical protein
MAFLSLRVLAAAVCAASLTCSGAALAQTGAPKPAEPQKQAAQPADPAQERQRKLDEFDEAHRQLQGAAGQHECVWLGRRIVSLLWRDDLDTAFRHLDLYDRFGCPGGHVQMTFRCLVRNGNIDPKVPESLPNRVHACWIDPSLDSAPTASAAPPAAAAPAPPQKR